MPAGRRQATSQESRQILIDAAAELFAEKGFRATTFEDIAARSGISRGSIPWHFGNKEGLLEAVMDDFRTTGTMAVETATNLNEGIDRLFDYLQRPTSKLLTTMLAEAVEPDSRLTPFYADLQTAMRRWLGIWARDIAPPEGADLNTFVSVLHGCIIGIHQQWRIAPDEVDLNAAKGIVKTLFVPQPTRGRRK
ncbi:TetR/AcrR family transcriptional regulator [Mycobacteriaceae bacterium NPDC060252]